MNWTIGQTSCTIFTWNRSEGQDCFDTHKPELFSHNFSANMTSVTIDRVLLRQVNLPPKVERTDAIQAFVIQETILLTLVCSDGIEATGYAYTIGTGGSSVVALLKDHLVPRLLGKNPVHIEAIWKDLFFHTHATAVGAMTSLALACVDTALWDWRAQSQALPLWQLLGGAQSKVPLYTTEGGWLQLSPEVLVEQTLKAKAEGFKGAKIKIGRPHVSEDVARLSAVRDAVGPGFEIMTDANQGFHRAEVVRRAKAFEGLDLAWLEEPLPAEDISGHRHLREHTNSTPIEYLTRCRLEHACSLLQSEPARSVTDIALACGFETSQYFATVFARHFGRSPRIWRDEGNGNSGRAKRRRG